MFKSNLGSIVLKDILDSKKLNLSLTSSAILTLGAILDLDLPKGVQILTFLILSVETNLSCM